MPRPPGNTSKEQDKRHTFRKNNPELASALITSSRTYRKNSASARKERFLGLLGNGYTIELACTEIGMARTTYNQWRNRDPYFRSQADQIRARRAGLHLVEDIRWDGGFSKFRKDFFGYETYWHQQEIVRAFESARPMSITMVLCPPEHGKTSVVEDWINYKLATDPNHRITIVSEAQKHAKKIVGRVQRRMNDPLIAPAYIKEFGPFRIPASDKPWTAEYLTVEKADHDERDYSLEARGSTSTIAGTRTDMLVIDDIQSRKNLNLTADLVETFRQDFLSRPGTEGKIIIVGTRVGMGDFYESLLDAGIINKLVCLPAIADDAEIVECPEGDDCEVPEIEHFQTLCPELWPPHKLAMKRKQVGPMAWWRNYQQKPQLEGDATFKEEWITAAESKMHNVGPAEPGWHVVVGVDPALGGGNALVCLAYNDKKIQILDAARDFGLSRTEEILARIEEFCYRYKPNDVVIEIAAFQRALARDDRLRELQSRFGFQTREHSTGMNKADPVLGVGSMAGSFERGEFIIPAGSDFSRRRMEPLKAELRSWRPDIATRRLRQDVVMAMWFAWRLVMERRAILAQQNVSWRRPGMPWKATTMEFGRKTGKQRAV